MHNHFQQNNELEQQHQIPYVLSPQLDLLKVRRGGNINLPAIDSRGRKSVAAAPGEENVVVVVEGSTNNEHCKLKKIMHRDIERQRRQQMGNLHASLRSLLPLEHIKGKRSISDHMHVAVNYIKHLQKRISELNIQNEKLMKITNLTTKNSETVSAAKSVLDCNLNVMASFCQDGVEILISRHEKGGPRDDNNNVVFPLSKVMKMLVVEGLDVVSCVSTKANETTLYRIISQADELSFIDVMELQKKLEDVIKQDSS